MFALRLKIITKLCLFHSLWNFNTLMRESHTASWDTKEGCREGKKKLLLQAKRNVYTGVLPSLLDSGLAMPLTWNRKKSIVIIQSLPPINWCMTVKHNSKLMVTQGTEVIFQKKAWAAHCTCPGLNFSPGQAPCPFSRQWWTDGKVYVPTQQPPGLELVRDFHKEDLVKVSGVLPKHCQRERACSS